MTIGKKIVVTASVAGAMAIAAFGINAIKDQRANAEIDERDYMTVSSWAFNEKLGPEIKKATSDGIITEAEFSRLCDLRAKVIRDDTIDSINSTIDSVNEIQKLRERIDKLSKEAEE